MSKRFPHQDYSVMEFRVKVDVVDDRLRHRMNVVVRGFRICCLVFISTSGRYHPRRPQKGPIMWSKKALLLPADLNKTRSGYKFKFKSLLLVPATLKLTVLSDRN